MPAPQQTGTCLVTGASSGIGAAIAHELAARGHSVTLVARREERLVSIAAQLASTHGVRAEAVRCDLTDPVARASLADRLQALGLRVDVLVSNAGIGTHGRLVELNPSKEVEQVQLMCEACVELCRVFAPTMVVRRSGAVLIVASLSAFQPVPNTATYGAAKAFLLSFGEALHAELRPLGITVSTLCPGPVRTEIFNADEKHPSERVFPAPAWLTAQRVARDAVDGLAHNRRVIVPGYINRLLAKSGRLIPHGLQLRVIERFYRT
ncbi:MAG: SDR family oxidoreductase [Solirubrobacteraceae bacterium]